MDSGMFRSLGGAFLTLLIGSFIAIALIVYVAMDKFVFSHKTFESTVRVKPDYRLRVLENGKATDTIFIYRFK